VIRIFLIFGSAVSLLILAVWSGPAKACVIVIKDLAVVTANSDKCIAPTEEDDIGVLDRQDLSEDHLAPLYPGFILWLSDAGRLEIVAKPGPGVFVNVGDAESDVTDGSGPGGLPQPQILATGTDHRVALGGRSTHQATDLSDVLRQAAKDYVAPYYDAIRRNSDVAEMIRLGSEAIHYLDDNPAAGLEPINRYQSISLDGNAADTGLPAPVFPRTGVDGSFHEIGSLAYYLAALRSFLFSGDGLIGASIIMILYIAIAGLRNLTRVLR